MMKSTWGDELIVTIVEYSELEGADKDHRFQLLAPHMCLEINVMNSN